MGWIERAWIGCVERSLKGLDRVTRRRGLSGGLPAHLVTGMAGEDAACFFLIRKGYKVVARRWCSGDAPGDVDLIAWDGPVLCVVEVKTRTARDANPAEIAVDSHKRNILRRLAHQYVRQMPQESAPPVRFDVISVYLEPGEESQFVHFEGNFTWSEQPER
jgi:putative endonuclease